MLPSQAACRQETKNKTPELLKAFGERLISLVLKSCGVQLLFLDWKPKMFLQNFAVSLTISGTVVWNTQQSTNRPSGIIKWPYKVRKFPWFWKFDCWGSWFFWVRVTKYQKASPSWCLRFWLPKLWVTVLSPALSVFIVWLQVVLSACVPCFSLPFILSSWPEMLCWFWLLSTLTGSVWKWLALRWTYCLKDVDRVAAR